MNVGQFLSSLTVSFLADIIRLRFYIKHKAAVYNQM